MVLPPSAPFDPEAFAAALSPFLRQPFDYWRSKRGDRDMPARADLDPVEMGAWLPQTMLAEPLPDGDFRFRLVGTDVRDRVGCEMTGRRLSELPVRRDHIDDLLEEYRLAVRQGLPQHHSHDHPQAHARKPIRFERLLLPLSRDGRSVDMLFGVRHDRVIGSGRQLPGAAPQMSLSRASRPQLNR